jgi:hypothetical protein
MQQTDTQRQAYEVPGQHLRWRASQLQAQGLPYQVQPAGGGIYIVIVQQPPALDPWAYAPQRQQQRRPRWDAAVILPWLLVLAVASIMAGTAYMVAANAGQDAPAAQQAAAKDAAKEDAKNAGPFAWLADWRPPWAGSDKPAARDAQEGGWRWPWEDAADAAGALVADVQSTVTTVSSVILGVLVLMIVLTLVRKMGGRR